jgi:uncharacterized membrane protein YwzB
MNWVSLSINIVSFVISVNIFFYLLKSMKIVTWVNKKRVRKISILFIIFIFWLLTSSTLRRINVDNGYYYITDGFFLGLFSSFTVQSWFYKTKMR